VTAHPHLVSRQRVPLLSPITVKFDRPIDTSRLAVGVYPAVPVHVERTPRRVTLSPAEPWAPDQRYLVQLVPLPGFDGRQLPGGWAAEFQTQPRLGVAGFWLGERQLGPRAFVNPGDRLDIRFPDAMSADSVTVLVAGSRADLSRSWSADINSVSLTLSGLLPYRPVSVEVRPGARTATGELLTEGGSVELVPVATLPSNFASGIGADGRGQTPIEVVIDNAPPARPPSGVQHADIVYEYLSEYQVSRMTAIFLGDLPNQIGPVRSCRMINPYLGFAFQGLTMCSGASVGTLHYMFGNPEGGPLVPGSINDFDLGHHFDRVGFKPAPHNVFTAAWQAGRLREEVPIPPAAYRVAPPRPDVLAGEPAGPPDVPLHSVSYSYDAGSGFYGRFDHGEPMIDAATGGQIQAKNVVHLHVPFRDAGWIEDDNGGAHSVWYDLLGEGPAEIYSNGRLIRATWHMGSAAGDWYYNNRTPVWFSDAAGKVLELNSGLTWIHVIGNGQTG
jgi:hypothetical protein